MKTQNQSTGKCYISVAEMMIDQGLGVSVFAKYAAHLESDLNDLMRVACAAVSCNDLKMRKMARDVLKKQGMVSLNGMKL